MTRNKKKFSPKFLLSFAILALVAVAAFVIPRPAEADPIEDFAKVEQRLGDKAAEVETLQEELDLLEERADAKLAAVAEFRGRIVQLREELDQAVARLNELAAEERSTLAALGDVVRVDYLKGSAGAWDVLAGPGDLSDALDQQNANGSLGDYANGLAEDLERAQKDIEGERKSLVSKKQNLENLEAEAAKQLAELESVRDARRQLLDSTQGQEDAYQRQYEELRSQLVEMGIFGRSGCARVGSRTWPGDGGYFNQCDPRWADIKLGYSDSSTLGDYGCGVVAIAMVHKFYYGIDTDPIRVNEYLKRSGGFYDDLLTWSSATRISGNHRGGADWSHINRELDAGRPVIVWVDRGPINHYVVLLKRDGGDYVMHDPIEGPRRDFSDHYSTGAVRQYLTFKQR